MEKMVKLRFEELYKSLKRKKLELIYELKTSTDHKEVEIVGNFD